MKIIFICIFHLLSIFNSAQSFKNPYLIILGTIQDAGSPHTGCQKSCCEELFKNPDASRKVVSLGIIDPLEKKYWLIDASPDFPSQCKILKSTAGFNHKETPDGIFLTHAHIGHYTGLMYLGRESLNSVDIPVYAMPRMQEFLAVNGPWSQLLKIKNIKLNKINTEEKIQLSRNISITPFLVPHRDEFSETVGYKIEGPKKTILFIPDIDKWEKWSKELVKEIKKVDLALLDGTFYDSKEINNRNISEIPHPFITETMELLENESKNARAKIKFIHFNHTNPLLDSISLESNTVIKNGFSIAKFKELISL